MDFCRSRSSATQSPKCRVRRRQGRRSSTVPPLLRSGEPSFDQPQAANGPTELQGSHLMSIVIAGLDESYPLVGDQENQPVFSGKASRPGAGVQILQWFRFSHPAQWVTAHRFHQLKDPEGGLSVRLYPITKVLHKIDIKNEFPGAFRATLRVQGRLLWPALGSSMTGRHPFGLS